MGILVINEYGRDTREVPLLQRLVRIGRDPRGEIVLADGGVSRAHAQILCGGSEVILEDLGSRNGTLVNDRRLSARERLPLRHGDIVRVGRSVIQFLVRISRKISAKLAGTAEAPHAGRSPDASAERSPAAADRVVPGAEAGNACLFTLAGLAPRLLVVPARGNVVPHVLRSDRVRIGRSAEADVVLDDPTVSEEHAEIVYNRSGFHLVDRDSAAGTFLDGVEVRVSRLDHRSYIRFGKLKSLFVVEEEGGEPPEASFVLRDRLVELHPERARVIQNAFRECREAGRDFAEELIRRGALDPEEWWEGSRGARDDTPSGAAGWLARLRGWGRRRS